jgi:membrane complex biogenesis BtpA family protein
MTWLETLFGNEKAVIGMVHFPPLPGTPLYDEHLGIEGILERIHHDVEALQAGGIDAVMFCNENDRPYVMKADPVVVATMARAIGEIRHSLRVPFGIDILWDAASAIAVAKATDASFVREVFTGTYDSDMGLWVTSAGESLRYRRTIGADKVRLLFNISAEFARPLAERSMGELAKSVTFSSIPDAICISGPRTGEAVEKSVLREVKDALPDTPTFVNTGTTVDNIGEMLSIVDGAIVGTSLKFDSVTWNAVDPDRTAAFMQAVAKARGD